MIAGLVLAGGESRRMGHDKALISINDQPAYLHFAKLLSDLCESVYVSCRTTQGLSFSDTEQINPVFDSADFADRGPLTGILSWLQQIQQEASAENLTEPNANVHGLLVVGCDYRNVDLETLSALVAIGQTQGRICCYQNHLNGIIDPLVAYYPMAELLELFQTQAQQTSLRLFVETHNACILPTNQHLLQVLKSFDR